MRIYRMSPSGLARALEVFDRHVAAGEPRPAALETAVRYLAQTSSDEAARLRRVRLTPATADAISAAMAAYLWRFYPARAERLMLDIPSVRRGRVDGLDVVRDEVIHALEAEGFHERLIGEALARDRTTILTSRRRMAKRLAGDELLAARLRGWIAEREQRRAA